MAAVICHGAASLWCAYWPCACLASALTLVLVVALTNVLMRLRQSLLQVGFLLSTVKIAMYAVIQARYRCDARASGCQDE